MGNDVRGADQLVGSLRAVARELAELTAADEAAGELLAGEVASSAPRVTGFLAQSVTHSGGRVEIGAPYAGVVHAANPWAAQTTAAKEAAVVDIYEQAIVDAVASVKGA